MNKLFLTFLLGTAAPLFASEPPAPVPFEEPQHLLINNRILAKVNGKTISVIDVVKKMDVFLDRAYPQYAQSKMARFQFYTAQWRNTLRQMIDNELILADAAATELKISDGDVRETLQERFGPNVMTNLEKIGISYEEAKEMILSEITVERMHWYKVNSKAYLSVNPQDIKTAYREYCEKNPADNEWKYQVLSLRGKDSDALALLAEKADDLRKQPDATLEMIHDQLKEELSPESDITLALSPLNEVTEKKLSLAHKKPLESLPQGAISHPIAQASRDGTSLFRLFYLKEKIVKELPAFEKMSDPLHQELLEKAASRETGKYLAKLRQKFSFDQEHFEASIPSDFQPFAIK
ncbi:MAG: hypothetical protein ACHQT8_01525 [Chlamydiales bacterium]